MIPAAYAAYAAAVICASPAPAGLTAVDPEKWDNNSGVLQQVPSGKFTRNLMFVSVSDDGTEFHAGTNYYSLYSAGSLITGSELSSGGTAGSANLPAPFSVSGITTVNGSQAITADWRVTSNTGTLTGNRTLICVRLQ